MEKIEWKGQSRCGYKGIKTQQNPNVFNEFINFFNNEKIDYVIEIGTSYGGFSLFLHEQSLQHNFNFITYDWSGFKGGSWNDRRGPLNKMFNNEIPFDFRDKNVFEHKDEIIEILKNNKCLLLCDGGDKPKEFNIFGEHLTKNSYIMAHDYASNRDNFNTNIKNKICNWFEIQDSDIQPTMDEYNIAKSKYFKEFSSVAWIQCIKE